MKTTNNYFKVGDYIAHEEDRLHLKEAMMHKKKGLPLATSTKPVLNRYRTIKRRDAVKGSDVKKIDEPVRKYQTYKRFESVNLS